MQKISQNKLKRLSQAKRLELSAEWEASELTQVEFCKLKGINLNTFVYWCSTSQQNTKKLFTGHHHSANNKAPTILRSYATTAERY